ncbi:hypothetical protein Vafri_11716 [Volvox africanus]|uniref:PAS domain-containing protein n=1 Tax=Volvox africanus TaxID=51714 RepID=A0A8J4F0W0_9CHLO|nr:hypothetical protein Vafri_11716 [Volvox africanus]
MEHQGAGVQGYLHPHASHALLAACRSMKMNFVVAFNPSFKVWHIDRNNPVWQVIRWTVWRSPIMRIYGYKTYIVIMYVMAAAVLLSVVGLAWLTLAMRRQEQSKLLRTASLGLHVVYDIFFVMCYVSFFDYFTFSADCDFLGTKKHMYFEGVECLKMPHLLHLLVALSVGLMFLGVTALVVVASCDLDPVSRGVLASPAAYVRLKILMAKAVYIVFANCLDSNFKVQAIGMVVSVALIVFWNLKSMPFYLNFTNIVWTGLWGGVMLPCIILTIIAFGKDKSDTFRHTMTQNVLYGMVPIIWVTMVLTGVYVWWTMRPARKFRNLELGVKLSKVYKFESVYQVERLARVMRKFNADGLVAEEAAALGEVIIKAGLQTFPNAPHLLILYANFVLEVHKDGPAARTQLQLVGKQMPNVVERYQVFCTNEASKRLKDSQEVGMDLQAYIEFKRNIRAVLRVHKEVLLQQSELWRLCMRSTLKVAQLDGALEALDLASARADRVYRRVLERYPTNGKLLRCYGKFLENVLHDQIAASRAYAGANRVGSSNALLSLDFGGALHNGVSNKKPDFLTSMSMEDDAVVVIDAEGTIMMVSQAVQKTFGYTKSDLEGANVSVLMPQPFSQRHTGYIQRYTDTGEAHVLDTVCEVVALHKERYVFPISLCVTKLSGIGTDSIFLGVIRPLPANLQNVRAWITPNGVLLCADQQFSSAIGMLEGDVVGHLLASLVMDANAVMGLLERCQAATMVELESGNITTQLTFHHCFAEPVPFRVEVRMAGSDAQRILVLHCRRTDGMDGSMLAVDTHMRIKFASCEVSLLLGYSMRKLANMRLDQLLPPPYNALHGKWLRDPPHTSRPGSCRTGSVVHLVSEAGVHVPVRLDIHNLEIEASGSSGTIPLYIVKVKKVTPEEVLREKRLVLTADFTGKILTVTPADSGVFEFRALSLLGTNLAESIDVFADWRKRSGETQMQMILLALLGKEQEMPGTSWRVRVHEPQPAEGSGAVASREIHRISRSACLQVELEEEDNTGEVDAETGVRIQVTLWRRDLLGGTLELDEELIIRRASPLTGLITGLPTTAMLRKPLRSFLNIPHMSWEKLVAASSHGHHKRSALKATNDRGSISPVMAFIGPHPDSGTMRLMVQGVETLAPGGRPKITLTVHPDTTFVGAHANIMRVLRLEDSINGVASIANSSVHGDDDAISHVGRLARANSAAPSALRFRSFNALTAPQPRFGPSPSGLLLVGPGDVRRAELTGKVAALRTGPIGKDCSSENDAEDDEFNGAVGDDDDESSDALMAEATSVHRQATSKSEFVEQWVRSITYQASLHQMEHQEQQHQSRKQRRNTKTATAVSATTAATAPGGPLLREESSLLALPLASSSAADGAFEPWLRTTSRLTTDTKLKSIAEVGTCAGAEGNVTDAQQARCSPNNVQERQRRVASRLLSFKYAGPSEPDGGEYPCKPADVVSHGGAETAEKGTDEADEAAKSDKGSTLDGSSVDGGSQGASAISSATDATSASEVVIDARRARLLKALNKLLLGPVLMKHMDRLRFRSYYLIAVMFLTHLIAYVIITSLIKKQYANVYSVHRQALAMDRSQLVVVRTVLGTYCERANVTEKVAGCIYTLNTSVSRLTKNLLQMEANHQGVYLGFDTNKIAKPAQKVYAVWTTPTVDYQVFLDTTPPQMVIERAGAWQLGNRFIAAAREAAYWMLRYKENFKFHRIYEFIISNGLDSLFKVYATSLDYLVLAAWESVRELRQSMCIP